MPTVLVAQVALVAGVNFLSALVQASTGFGYALVAMPLMALFLPMATCSAISAVTIVAIGLQMSWKLRENLKLSTIALPVLCCLGTINVGLLLLSMFDEMALRIILASLLLVVTALSLLMRKVSIGISGKWYFAVAAGLLTGLSAGMFNVIGPFLILYYINVCDDTLHMKASLEFSFLTAGLYTSAMHLFAYGNINAAVAPHIGAAVAAALSAGLLGLKVFKKLNRNIISIFVYTLLPVMAFILVLNGVR
ncbi:MAG: sulfite exporter TauE/SafE family protein [Sphaerochaeta sp.]|nr:sulfite exporter TauE/SafE family protein [Sphaerochaeta sp.]